MLSAELAAVPAAGLVAELVVGPFVLLRPVQSPEHAPGELEWPAPEPVLQWLPARLALSLLPLWWPSMDPEIGLERVPVLEPEPVLAPELLPEPELLPQAALLGMTTLEQAKSWQQLGRV